MELWLVLFVLGASQAAYFLIRYTRTQRDLLSPSAVVALVLLIWFYPKLPDLRSNAGFSEDVITDFLLFWLLCQTSLFVGANLRLPRGPKASRETPPQQSFARWMLVTWLFFLVGAVAFYHYSQLPAAELYMRQPAGRITILLFLSTFLSVATILAAIWFATTRQWVALVPLAAGLLLYADRIIIHGKRSDLFELIFLAGVLWVILLRRRVPLWVPVVAALLMMAFNSVVSEYRQIMKRDNRDLHQLTEIAVVEIGREAAFRADHDITNAVATIAAYRSPNVPFRWGADYWNVLIHRYVPGQIVGADVKRSLIIDVPDPLWQELRYSVQTGTAVFVAGGVFRNFGWFGCLALFLYGLVMRFLFLAAQTRAVGYLALYILYGGMIPVVLIFGLTQMVPSLVLWVPLLVIAQRFASRQPRAPLRSWRRGRVAS